MNLVRRRPSIDLIDLAATSQNDAACNLLAAVAATEVARRFPGAVCFSAIWDIVNSSDGMKCAREGLSLGACKALRG
ncbi:unnamed protein product, partial [Amoebophrya sp. A25]|eukprot:GSA25T00014725001.1